MALSQRLEFRQSQALVMTPQLMQAIKLLQLSSLDLAAYVEGELERNPLLERAEADDTPLPGAEPEAPVLERDESTAATPDWIGENLETSRASMEQGLGTELENVFPDDGGEKTAPVETPPPAYSEWSGVGTGGSEDSSYNLESFITAEITLADHLAAQMALAISDPVGRMIGRYLVDMVDETGYLSGDLDTVAEKLGAKRDLAALRRLCGVSDEDLVDMIAEIRNLNPKPGLAFGSTLVQPIVPDVYVRAAPDGSWQVELNSDTLPKVLISQRYYAQVSKTTRNDKDKTYIADCLQTATWLVRALDQRAKTILKVSSEIVRQQDGFFAKGVQHLRPLNLKAVADAIGMHESTVSRVTANKYMATSRGIFELKYFFTSSIAASNGGEAHSAEAVRHRIRLLIDGETAIDVLSDDTIVDKLRDVGIDIARRTVAKYREAMRIPSSVQRRREKQAANA